MLVGHRQSDSPVSIKVQIPTHPKLADEYRFPRTRSWPMLSDLDLYGNRLRDEEFTKIKHLKVIRH